MHVNVHVCVWMRMCVGCVDVHKNFVLLRLKSTSFHSFDCLGFDVGDVFCCQFVQLCYFITSHDVIIIFIGYQYSVKCYCL